MPPGAHCRRSKRATSSRQIQESAYRAQQAIDAGTAIVVGVNRFTTRDSGLGTADSVNSFSHRSRTRAAADRTRARRARRPQRTATGRTRSMPWIERRATDPISCRRSSPLSRNTPRSAKLPTGSGRSSASIRTFPAADGRSSPRRSAPVRHLRRPFPRPSRRSRM